MKYGPERERQGGGRCLALLLSLMGMGLLLGQSLVTDLSVVMPSAEDFSTMWWREGFPERVPGAPWRRCVQTGSYAFELDTETLQVTHLAQVPAGLAVGDEEVWATPQPAELSLAIVVAGERYLCREGAPWSRHGGPRVIESGQWVQRADVTELSFVSEQGEVLNAEARFETVAWPDRLGFILAARPGLEVIVAGEESFGRVGGGLGLTGGNELQLAKEEVSVTSQFTFEMWALIPFGFDVSGANTPWLACCHRNENADGNFGFVVQGGKLKARLNVGGGRENQFEVSARKGVRVGSWNHLAMSYDGETLRLFLNGSEDGAVKVGREFAAGPRSLTLGNRDDSVGRERYRFRGVIDEVRLYGKALKPAAIERGFRKANQPIEAKGVVVEKSFRADGPTADGLFREEWQGSEWEVVVSQGEKTWREAQVVSTSGAWEEVGLTLDPATFHRPPVRHYVEVAAQSIAGEKCAVEFDPLRSRYRIDLDQVVARLPTGELGKSNDAMERVELSLTNPTKSSQVARLCFEKTGRGFRGMLGSSITGVTAVLRDREGQPTGIPVQLSKNWHNGPEGLPQSGTWFHGLTQLTIPPESRVELELCLAYGHWGGVPAVSHSQLSLIGWGSNQLWEQSALGSWGESICYEPDQGQAGCLMTDVRPAMVSASEEKRWGWTCNVGGGDFFRLFDAAGERVPPRRMMTEKVRQGPCLTEVSYAGLTGGGLRHSVTTSIGRTDDLVRGTYRIRMDVDQAVDFSRLVICQFGADSYHYGREGAFAMGSGTQVEKEWRAEWGGDVYRTEAMALRGAARWVSLHEGSAREGDKFGVWANRGLVVRAWEARLGGKKVAPHFAERGSGRGLSASSTIDLLPPPRFKALQVGDYVEATIELVVMPQFGDDYYGASEELSSALRTRENTASLIAREAVGNSHEVVMTVGELTHCHPDVRVVRRRILLNSLCVRG